MLTVCTWSCSSVSLFCLLVLLVVCGDVWMRKFPVRNTDFFVGREIRLVFLVFFFCNLENVVLS